MITLRFYEELNRFLSKQHRRTTIDIPADIRKEHAILSVCTGCDRVYWPGSHYEGMKNEILRLTGVEKGPE